MSAWVLIPAARSFVEAVDRLAPARDHGSDGTIGDTAHQAAVSDHNPDETGAVPIHDSDKINEVHAVDVDADLRESDLTMARLVDFLTKRCRTGAERRLRYIIWNRTIWHVNAGWKPDFYLGSDPHTGHGHFSFSYDTVLEASTADWHLEEIAVALTPADKTWITQQLAERELTLGTRIGDKGRPGRTLGQVLNDLAALRGYLVGDPVDTATAAIPDGSPLARAVAALDGLVADVAHNNAGES